jgi:hypothetical protein
MSPELEQLVAKQAITEVLHRYCHGLDTMDRELSETVWHDDAMAFYQDVYDGPVQGLLDLLWKIHARMDALSHQVTNILIEVDGDSATSATHVTAALQWPTRETVVRGRYLDTWSRRGGEWRIDVRRFVPAFFQTFPREGDDA